MSATTAVLFTSHVISLYTVDVGLVTHPVHKVNCVPPALVEVVIVGWHNGKTQDDCRENNWWKYIAPQNSFNLKF